MTSNRLYDSDHTMRRTAIAGFLALLVTMGCDDKKAESTSSDSGLAETVDDGAPSAERDAAASTDAADQMADTADAGASAHLLPISPLGPARPLTALDETIDGPVLGALQGEAFGDSSAVYGVVRLNCGAGTILQPIFRRTPESNLEVAPPIPVQFYGLQTGRPVTYEDEGFRVTVDFEEDSPDRLAGEFSITYKAGTEERIYARMTYDGPPLSSSFPPRMEGDGELPIYPDCFPSGYYAATTSDGETRYGLIRIVDIDGRGVPFARLLVGDKSALQLMVIPRNPGNGIDPPAKVELADARRTEGDLGVLVDAHHRPELIEPSEAIGGNLGTLQESKVLQGTASVRIFEQGGDHYFAGNFEDVRVSSIIDGPLSGLEFDQIRIFGKMVGPRKMPVQLTDPPEWYDSKVGRDDATEASPD